MSTSSLTFLHALEQAELLARQALPTVQHERLSCAVALVQAGKVLQRDDGHTWDVESASKPEVTYTVNGACSCEDAHYRAPQGRCKHILATLLARKALQLVQESQAAPVCDPVMAESQTPPEAPTGIDPRFLTYLHGKPFIKYAGLLAMAHERGLVSLKARFISVTSELALAEAEAVFADGRTHTEAADSTPQNVPAHIRPHFPRMALTRSKARALRDALNIGITALEELEGGSEA